MSNANVPVSPNTMAVGDTVIGTFDNESGSTAECGNTVTSDANVDRTVARL